MNAMDCSVPVYEFRFGDQSFTADDITDTYFDVIKISSEHPEEKEYLDEIIKYAKQKGVKISKAEAEVFVHRVFEAYDEFKKKLGPLPGQQIDSDVGPLVLDPSTLPSIEPTASDSTQSQNNTPEQPTPNSPPSASNI